MLVELRELTLHLVPVLLGAGVEGNLQLTISPDELLQGAAQWRHKSHRFKNWTDARQNAKA